MITLYTSSDITVVPSLVLVVGKTPNTVLLPVWIAAVVVTPHIAVAVSVGYFHIPSLALQPRYGVAHIATVCSTIASLTVNSLQTTVYKKDAVLKSTQARDKTKEGSQ